MRAQNRSPRTTDRFSRGIKPDMRQHSQYKTAPWPRDTRDTFKNQANWEAFDAGNIGGLETKGYFGIAYDGHYIYLRNFKPERWPKGNPETGYLNCDGSPTKTYILDTRRKKGVMEYWQLNFGKRVAEELYDIKSDPFCMKNLADDESLAERKSKMMEEMTLKLTEQGDPRILGNGDIFDNYTYSSPATRDYYNRYMGGEEVPAGWVNKTDYDSDLMEYN